MLEGRLENTEFLAPTGAAAAATATAAPTAPARPVARKGGRRMQGRHERRDIGGLPHELAPGALGSFGIAHMIRPTPCHGEASFVN